MAFLILDYLHFARIQVHLDLQYKPIQVISNAELYHF